VGCVCVGCVCGCGGGGGGGSCVYKALPVYAAPRPHLHTHSPPTYAGSVGPWICFECPSVLWNCFLGLLRRLNHSRLAVWLGLALARQRQCQHSVVQCCPLGPRCSIHPVLPQAPLATPATARSYIVAQSASWSAKDRGQGTQRPACSTCRRGRSSGR
jgi:hypothetical protein